MQALVALLRRRLLQNVAALLSLRFVQMLLPLAVVPFLTRVLGPTEWGRLVMAQTLGMWGIVAIQYGFDLSATRSVARERDQPDQLRRIVAGVAGAQLLLVLGFLAAGSLLAFLVPAFAEMRPLVIWSMVHAVTRGLVPVWYFLGQERLVSISTFELVAGLASFGAILAVVRLPTDAWKVLAVYAMASTGLVVVTAGLMLVEVGRIRLSLSGALHTLRDGLDLGLVRVLATALAAGSTMLVGVLLTPRHLAFFAVAERLCQALAHVFGPINTALMPRMINLLGAAPERADQLARISLAVLLGLSVLIAGAIAMSAGWLVPLVFGPGYEDAVPVVRVMAPFIPLMVANATLAMQWMVPRGLDRSLMVLVIGGAALQMILALIVIPHYEAVGMAAIVVLVQVVVVTSFVIVLHAHGVNLLTTRASK